MTASNLVYGPQIPYVTLIPGGLLPGKAVVFKGLVLSGKGKRFELNLCCGLLVDGDHKDNVALHFNPRFEEKGVVLNSLVNNKWGPEERYDMPFKQGQAMEVRLLALTDVIKIAVNGRHFCDFRHRLALQEVKTLYVKGCIQLDYIQFEGDQSFAPYADRTQPVQHPYQQQAPYAPQTGGFPAGSQLPQSHAMPSPTGTAPNFAAPGAAAGSHPQGHSAPIFKPGVPYTMSFPGGLEFRQQIFITGTPTKHAERFTIDFSAKGDVLFHFNPRFKDKVVVRNTMRKGVWETEERTSPNFPFLEGGTFDLILLCDNDGFKVAVNGQHFVHYAHRVPPQAVDAMTISGDLSLQQIHVQ